MCHLPLAVDCNHSNDHSQTKKEIAHVVEKMCHQLDATAKERIVTLSGEILSNFEFACHYFLKIFFVFLRIPSLSAQPGHGDHEGVP